MYNGIIIVNKEKAFTSHDVVAKLRGILRQKKIGHTGTLDPDAEGVLPVCLGNATKLCDLLTEKNKVYEVVLLLGTKTNTQDLTGTVLEQKEVNGSHEEIVRVIQGFVGEYDQIPPMFSALKVNGRKLYDLAREGIEIEREPRRVQIMNIKIMSIHLEDHEIKMEVECSKGTYIRTLCHDIGEKLGCGGCMKYLRRTRVSQFEIKNALTLQQIEEKRDLDEIKNILIPTEDIFQNYPKLILDSETDRFLNNGNKISFEQLGEEFKDQQMLRVYDSERIFKAVYVAHEMEKEIRPFKMFF